MSTSKLSILASISRRMIKLVDDATTLKFFNTEITQAEQQLEEFYRLLKHKLVSLRENVELLQNEDKKIV